MNRKTLDKIVCTYCSTKLTLNEFDGNDKKLMDSVLTCSECGAWFPISAGIGNMLPEHFTDKKKREEFVNKWKFQPPEREITDDEMPEAEKMKQINFYNEDSDEYDENMESTPFWKANDWNCINEWLPKIKPGQLMLDIGCGTGRASIPFAREGVNVIGFDISEGMVTWAREKSIELGLEDCTDYLVGDAENPPFQDEAFDHVIVFGVLHHVPEPIKVLKNIRRLLKSTGYYFGHENNKTVFRPLFDLSMKIFKLWNEEAGNHPLISQQELRDWSLKAGLNVESTTSVFIPPQIFNLIGEKNAKHLLVLSDSICNSIPVLKGNGGVLKIEGKPL